MNVHTVRQILQTMVIALSFVSFWEPFAPFPALAALRTRLVADLAPFLWRQGLEEGCKRRLLVARGWEAFHFWDEVGGHLNGGKDVPSSHAFCGVWQRYNE